MSDDKKPMNYVLEHSPLGALHTRTSLIGFIDGDGVCQSGKLADADDIHISISETEFDVVLKQLLDVLKSERFNANSSRGAYSIVRLADVYLHCRGTMPIVLQNLLEQGHPMFKKMEKVFGQDSKGVET